MFCKSEKHLLFFLLSAFSMFLILQWHYVNFYESRYKSFPLYNSLTPPIDKKNLKGQR